MLTFLFSQDGRTALELASNADVKTAFVEHAEHSDITDDNKDTLLLLCARLGLASRVRAVLQAGANAAHTNQVRVRRDSAGVVRGYLYTCVMYLVTARYTIYVYMYIMHNKDPAFGH